MIELTTADETLLLCILIMCLGACFVWAFREFEQARNSHNSRVRKFRKLTLR
jgi:cbb3-type cytochrome oxidase subunit 3